VPFGADEILSANMKSTLNKHRLNNLLRGIQTSINLFESQGHTDVYFTAQFYRAGRKQNCIERGDLLSFSKQVRTYIASEDADAARIEFFSESTGKSIYSKALNDLRTSSAVNTSEQPIAAAPVGLGYAGLGEAQVTELINRKVAEERRNDEFQRLNKEVDELRTQNETLKEKASDLEVKLKAKSEIEFYSGIIGTAFPALAPLFHGTPLAQAAGFLAGSGDEAEKPSLPSVSTNETEESQSIASLISEFCTTLNPQELSAVHLLFMAFEADRAKIQSALHHVTGMAPVEAALGSASGL
jgi:hypothetical protein